MQEMCQDINIIDKLLNILLKNKILILSQLFFVYFLTIYAILYNF